MKEEYRPDQKQTEKEEKVVLFRNYSDKNREVSGTSSKKNIVNNIIKAFLKQLEEVSQEEKNLEEVSQEG